MTTSRLPRCAAVLLCAPLAAAPLAAGDCPSELAAHLDPVAGGLSWAVEATVSHGWMAGSETDRSTRTGNLLFGLDYRPSVGSPHQLYLEAGLKHWYKSVEGPGQGANSLGWGDYPAPEKRHFGLREAFYHFETPNTVLRTGLQSMSWGGSLLLDERVLGASLSHEAGRLRIDLSVGTVSTDFARMGDFCSTRHVYRLVRGGRLQLVGNDLGETNLAGGMISWNPSRSAGGGDVEVEPASIDEDELVFEEVDDEFSPLADENEGAVRKLALMFLEEFGNGFHDYKYYLGGLAQLALPGSVRMDLEVVGQRIPDDRAVAYLVAFRKDRIWGSGAFSDVAFGYLGRIEVDDGARFYPAFSNLFMGEVVRLDTPDLPLYFGEVTHTLPWRFKPSISALLVKQERGDRTSELDLVLGLRLRDGLRLSARYSGIRSDRLQEPVHGSRVELRWAF